jgi:GntR family transcriptional regulator, transcriptional repressor for pyruvate dehydrogenase complex
MFDISHFKRGGMFKKIGENRRYQRIVDQILEAIFRGDLKPKDKLPSEHELAGTFGVSRITVREAIRYLEQFGFLEVRQGSTGGAYIKGVDLNDIAAQMGNVLRVGNITFPHLADARAYLESMILANLVSTEKVAECIKKMEENVEISEKHYKAKRNKKRIAANFEFHTLISEMTENPIIILMHKLIVNLSMAFFENVKPSIPMVEKTLSEHRQIAELLKEGKFQEASNLCGAHIKMVSQRIIDKSKKQSLLAKDIVRKVQE